MSIKAEIQGAVLSVGVTSDVIATKAQVIFASEEYTHILKSGEKKPFANHISWQDKVFTSGPIIDFSGQAGTTVFLYSADTRVLLVGIGKEADVKTTTLRAATASAVDALKAKKISHAQLHLPVDAEVDRAQIAKAVARTAVLQNHVFVKYYHLEANKKFFVESLDLVILNESEKDACSAAVKDTLTVAKATLLSRELGNERADVADPAYMEQAARAVADRHSTISFNSVVGEDLVKEGLNLIYNVGKGSPVERCARVVLLEYKGNPEDSNAIAIVGKGITFDTGGLNIKATGFMEDMHYDKCGSCAALAAIDAIAELGLKQNVVVALALAENSIGANAYKPKAWIPSAAGVVEISNTDAEGRLAMASAMTLVQRRHPNVNKMLNIATLTGAQIVALGHYFAGGFTPSDDFAQRFTAAGNDVWERVWRLPVTEEYSKELRGAQCDIKSMGNGRAGGSSTAAAFLKEFVNDGVEWGHLDIAGPSNNKKPGLHFSNSAGATGFGAALLVEFVRRL